MESIALLEWDPLGGSAPGYSVEMAQKCSGSLPSLKNLVHVAPILEAGVTRYLSYTAARGDNGDTPLTLQRCAVAEA